jgi:hypothetical protein
VVMGRHGFGQGEYKYFAYPLPPMIENLRSALYPRLAPIANRWNLAMGSSVRYPEVHADFSEDATMQVNNDRPHCCFSTVQATSTACTRICMESMSSPYR